MIDTTKPIIDSAREAFGHIVDGITDEECLCLRIRQLSNALDERNAVQNTNVLLRKENEILHAQIRELLKSVSQP